MTEASKTAAIPFYKLVANTVDLASAFKSAVDAFNARNLATLVDLCDDNVVVVAVKRQAHHCGKEAVSVYFAELFKVKKSTFTPTTSDTSINRAGNIAHIIGDAEWSDYDPRGPRDAHDDCTIHYAFNFVNRGDGWLISSLWGAPDDLRGPQP